MRKPTRRKFVQAWQFAMLALIFAWPLAAPAEVPPSFDWVQRSGAIWATSSALDADGNIYMTGMWGYGPADFGTNVLTTTNGNYKPYLAKLDKTGNWLWARKIECTNSLVGWSVAVDSSNQVLIAGCLLNTPQEQGASNVIVDFGDLMVLLSTNHTDFEAFLAKYDSNGTFLWAKGTDIPNANYFMSVAIDRTNNIFLAAGFFAGRTNLGLRKLDASGNLVWQLGATNDQLALHSAAVDAEGNVFVSGIVWGSSSLGGLAITNVTISPSLLVAKIANNGVPLWAKSAPLGVASWTRLVLDRATNICVSGKTRMGEVFGEALDAEGYPHRPFVVKLSSEGDILWARSPADASGVLQTGTGSSFATGITADPAGNIYLSSEFAHPVRFGNQTITPTGSSDAFIAKYSPGGDFRWVMQTSGPVTNGAYAQSWCLTAGREGILVGGVFDNLRSFGPNQLTSSSYPNAFIASLPHSPPTLEISRTGSNLALSWPTFPDGYLLESSPAISPASWTTNGTAIQTNNGIHSAALPLDGPAQFFRLRRP